MLGKLAVGLAVLLASPGLVVNAQECSESEQSQESCSAQGGALVDWPEKTLNVTANEATCGTFEICECPAPGQPLVLRARFTLAGNANGDNFRVTAGLAGPGAEFLTFETNTYPAEQAEFLSRFVGCVPGPACSWTGSADDECNTCSTGASDICEAENDNLFVPGSTVKCNCRSDLFGGLPQSQGEYFTNVVVSLAEGVDGGSVDCTATVMTTISSASLVPGSEEPVDLPTCTANLAQVCPFCTPLGSVLKCAKPISDCLFDKSCNAEFALSNSGSATLAENASDKMKDAHHCLRCGEPTAAAGKCSAVPELASWPAVSDPTQEVTCGKVEICGCPLPGSHIKLRAEFTAFVGESSQSTLSTVALVGPGASNLKVEYGVSPVSDTTNAYICSVAETPNSGPCSTGTCVAECGTTLDADSVCNGGKAALVGGPDCLCAIDTLAVAETTPQEYFLDAKISYRDGVDPFAAGLDCNSTVALVISGTGSNGKCVAPLQHVCPTCGHSESELPTIDAEIIVASCAAETAACNADPGCFFKVFSAFLSNNFEVVGGTPATHRNMIECARCAVLGDGCPTEVGIDLSDKFDDVVGETCDAVLRACIPDPVCFAQANLTAAVGALPSNPTGPQFIALYNCIECVFSTKANFGQCNGTYTPGDNTPSTSSGSALARAIALPVLGLWHLAATHALV